MRYLLLFILGFFLLQPAQGSHLLGGEITYKCLGNGLFRFTVIVYRDCSGISFSQSSVNLTGPVNVSCALVNTFDITPRGPVATGNIRCNPPTTYNAGKGGIAKFIYEGTVDLRSLATTPQQGYTWYTSNIPCCRNMSNNSTCSGDLILRVVMRPFSNEQGTILSPTELCDDSPEFAMVPTSVFVRNPNDTAIINNSGRDKNSEDELRFFIERPWTGNNIPCDYNQGYTLTNPLPGLIVPTIDSTSGLTRLKPNTSGTFQTAVRLESRRCGQVIAVVYRDFQLNIINNPAGARPLFNPNAPVEEVLYQQKAPIFINASNWATGSLSQQVTLYAGDTLVYPIMAFDHYPLYDAPSSQQPTPVYNPDDVTVFVSSNQLGANGNDPTQGCLTPPCAVLQQGGTATASPVRYSAESDLMGYGYTNSLNVSTNLVWIPGCGGQIDTLEGVCSSSGKTYQFSLGAMDDASPLRGVSSRLLQVRVIGSPEIPAPVFRQLSMDPGGQLVRLGWSQLIDTTSIDPIDLANYPNASPAELRQRSAQRRLNAFGGIEIQRAEFQGTFTTLALINDLNTLSWDDSTIVAGTTYYYRLASVNACTEKRNYSEELKTLQFVFGHDWATGTAELSWDSLSLNTFVPASFTGQTLVEAENYTTQPGTWQIRGATFVALNEYSEIPQSFGDSINFRIGFVDSSGLISYSRAFGSTFDLDALSVDNQELSHFQLYPNPADDRLHLKLSAKICGIVEMNVYDIRGRLVQQKQLNADESHLIDLEIADLVPGVYQLSLRQDQQLVGVQRFVKR